VFQHPVPPPPGPYESWQEAYRDARQGTMLGLEGVPSQSTGQLRSRSERDRRAESALHEVAYEQSVSRQGTTASAWLSRGRQPASGSAGDDSQRLAQQGTTASAWLSRGRQPAPGSAGGDSQRLDRRRKVWPRHILQGPGVTLPGTRPVFLCGDGFTLVYRGAVGPQSCRAFHALRDDNEIFQTSIASKTPARQNLSPRSYRY
jgi:hypothetical protein